MNRIAISVNLGDFERTELVFERARRAGGSGAAGHGGLEGRRNVIDLQRDRLDAVAVGHEPLGVGVQGRQRRCQDKRDVSLAQHIGGFGAHPGLEPRVGNHIEAERVAIKIRRLPCIAHEHSHVVDAFQSQRIGGHCRGSCTS